MKKNIFVSVILICLIVPLLIFSAYSLGSNSDGSYSEGFKTGNETGFQQGFALGNVGGNTRSYDAGYQAGLKVQNP